jgi:hypothetical protein
MEQIAGVVASGQIPELACRQRWRVERHETIGEEQRGADGVGMVLHQSRAADEARATG